MFPLRSSSVVLSLVVFCPRICFSLGWQWRHSSMLILFDMMLCDNKGLRLLLCVGREKLQCKTFCHVLKYSTLLDPLLLKSKQWGIKHSCKEVGVRKTGFTLLRGNWWWQSVLYLSLQLLNSLLLELALEAKHVLHTTCTVHCVLWFCLISLLRKKTGTKSCQ